MLRQLTLFLLLSFLTVTSLSAQAIDGSFAHETDPDKKYSLYIPSGYDSNTPSQLMLGFHPLNTNRWDAQAWRDTLIVFAESNNLILACPDGGLDGRVDDDIDTSFTSVLLDSMDLWYNIDQNEKYVMGFSWGGKTTYSYGLRRTEKFRGYLVIGAAIEFSEVGAVMPNAMNEAFYLLHGAEDNAAVRYHPLLGALDAVDACTNSMLMEGVGHTIDFPNRNQLLNDAFQWLKDTNCASTSTLEFNQEIEIYPNPTSSLINVLGIELNNTRVSITDLSGKSIAFSLIGNAILVDESFSGILILNLQDENSLLVKRVVKL